MHPYIATRLDFFLVSDNLQKNVQTVEVSQSIMFDHKIVFLYLSNYCTKRYVTTYFMGNTKMCYPR